MPSTGQPICTQKVHVQGVTERVQYHVEIDSVVLESGTSVAASASLNSANMSVIYPVLTYHCSGLVGMLCKQALSSVRLYTSATLVWMVSSCLLVTGRERQLYRRCYSTVGWGDLFAAAPS